MRCSRDQGPEGVPCIYSFTSGRRSKDRQRANSTGIRALEIHSWWTHPTQVLAVHGGVVMLRVCTWGFPSHGGVSCTLHCACSNTRQPDVHPDVHPPKQNVHKNVHFWIQLFHLGCTTRFWSMYIFLIFCTTSFWELCSFMYNQIMDLYMRMCNSNYEVVQLYVHLE